MRRIAALACLAGCSELPAYTCRVHGDCASAGAAMFCEASGWCSVADGGCTSGRRYVAEAGDGLADQCVPPALGDAGTGDAPAGSDAPGLDAQGPAFGPAVPIAALNSSDHDGGPSLTSDGLEIYFHSNRAGGDFEIYRSVRASTGAGWDPPEIVSELNVPGALDISPCVSADNRSLWITSTRDGSFDIFLSTRARASDPWGAPAPVGEINSMFADAGLSVTSSSLLAVLHSDRGEPDNDLFFTSRGAATAPWGPPQRLPELDSGLHEADPFLFDDARTIVFASQSGAPSGRDLYVASRLVAFGPFGPPQPILELNSLSNDDQPWLTPDAGTVIFVSDRDGDGNLYEAHR